MGVKPICGDYLHNIAHVKSKMNLGAKEFHPNNGNEEEKKE